MSDLRPYDYGSLAGEVFEAQEALNKAVENAQAAGFHVGLELNGKEDRLFATVARDVLKRDNNIIDKTPE